MKPPRKSLTKSTDRKPTDRLLPADIKPRWLDVVRRLQSVARKQSGYAIVSIKVVVDQDGYPVHWTNPKMVKIEPARSGLEELLEALGD